MSTSNQTRSLTVSSSGKDNHVAQQIPALNIELPTVSQHQTGLVPEKSPQNIALTSSPLNDQSNKSPSLITTFHAYRNSYSQGTKISKNIIILHQFSQLLIFQLHTILIAFILSTRYFFSSKKYESIQATRTKFLWPIYSI